MNSANVWVTVKIGMYLLLVWGSAVIGTLCLIVVTALRSRFSRTIQHYPAADPGSNPDSSTALGGP